MKNYVGKRCWQANGRTTIIFGNVVSQKMENKWLLVEVRWDHNPITTWEKILNVSFEEINSWKLIS